MSAGHRALQRKDYKAADKWFSAAVEQSGRNDAETLGLLRSLSSLAFVYQQENNDLGKSHTEIVRARNGLATISARTKPSPPDSDRADQKAAATQSSSPRRWWQLRFGKRSQ